jgi:hypothetical protein
MDSSLSQLLLSMGIESQIQGAVDIRFGALRAE